MTNGMKQINFKILAFLLSGVMLLQVAACGTLIYPERRGQSTGELDPVIVTLDAIGLLFFLIPGIAAFIIDFDTGAVYLPAGQGSKQRLNKIRQGFKGAKVDIGSDGSVLVHVDPSQLTPENIESFGKLVGGESFSFSHPALEVRKVQEVASAERTSLSWKTTAFSLRSDAELAM